MLLHIEYFKILYYTIQIVDETGAPNPSIVLKNCVCVCLFIKLCVLKVKNIPSLQPLAFISFLVVRLPFETLSFSFELASNRDIANYFKKFISKLCYMSKKDKLY